MGSFSIWHVLIVLIICLFFFGPRRLPDLGTSLGKAIRGFKQGLKDAEGEDEEREASNAREALPAGTGKSKKASTKKKSHS